MAVKIIVSSEELKQTLEYISLIAGASPGKKDDGLKNLSNSVKITAISPCCNKNYMLIFECVGNNEQLLYRMEGKSYEDTEKAEITVELRKLASLAKSFDGDVELNFDINELIISAGGGLFKLPAQVIPFPNLKPPEGTEKIVLNVSFLQEAVRYCTVATAVKDNGRAVLCCMQINLKADGSAICFATNTHKLAKFVATKTGSRTDRTFLLLPINIQHIVDICDENEITINPNDKFFFAKTPRLEYLCYIVDGNFLDCENVFQKIKPVKRIVASKRKLLTAIYRASIMTGDENDQRIKFASDNKNMMIESISVNGSGLDCIPLDRTDGKDDQGYNVSAFNISRLISNIPSDSVEISTQGHNLKPILIKEPNSDSGYILAPMR